MTTQEKFAIFVVGPLNSGKSTTIRSLTGCPRCRTWNLRSLGGTPLRAFVILSAPQEMGLSKYPPGRFPQAIEERYKVNRKDYDLLICPLELNVNNPALFGYDRYVQTARNQGFDARIAVIERQWNGTQVDVADVNAAQSFAQHNNIPFVRIDASNDPSTTATNVRSNLYPT